MNRRGAGPEEMVQALAEELATALEQQPAMSEILRIIQRSMLLKELESRIAEPREALEQQTATGAILRAIAAAPTDIQPILDAVAESAARLCGAFDSVILLKEGDVLSIKAHHGTIPIDVKKWPVGRDWVTGRAFLDGKPVHVPDLLNAANEFPAGQASAMRQGHRTILAVPLLREGQAIGALVIRRLEVRPFEHKQIDLLTTFADQAVIAIENARLFDEAQQRNRELTATGDVLKVISRSPTDVQPVFDAIAESAARLCDAYDSVIFVREGDDLVVGAHHGPIPMDGTKRRISRQWFTGRAVVDRVPMHIHDLLAEGDEFPESRADALRQGHRTILAVPLLSEGDAIGALVIRRLEVRPFTEKQIELLHTFADQSVIAINNVRHFDEIGERNRELSEALEQQTATSGVLRVIAASPTDIQPVLDALVESAGKLCDAYDTTIFLRKDDILTVAAHHGAIPLDVPELPLKRDLVTGRAVLDRAPVHVPDLTVEKDEYPRGSIMARRLGFKTILAIPLLRQGEAIGALMIRRDYMESFSQKQIDLLKTFADQAVIAIENVRLFKQVQARTAELTEALQQQTATADVLKVISRSAFDLNAVFQTLLDSAARLCAADRGVISRREGDLLRIVAGYQVTPEHFAYEQSHPHPIGRGTFHGRAALEGATIHVPDVLLDPEYERPEAAITGRFRAVVAVPIRREGDVVGVFGLGKEAPGPFTRRQVELVETFADQAAIAIENVRLFDEVQARTRELQQSLEYQTATSEVLNVISRSPAELQPVLDVIIGTAVRLCEADFGTIAREREGGFVRTGQYGSISPEYRDLMSNSPVEMTRGSITGRTLLEAKVVHVLDAKADPEYTFKEALKLEEIRTGLGVPLLRKGTPIGAIALIRRTVRPFTSKQIELVTIFADQAVIAIENARLFEEVQARTRELAEALDQQTATSNVLKVISRSAFDLKAVFQTLIESAAQLCGGEGSAIYTRQGDVYRAAATHGLDEEWRASELRSEFLAERRTMVGRVALSGSTAEIADVRLDPEYDYRRTENTSFRSMIGVPILREKQVIGVFVLAKREPGAFGPRQVELVESFADQAAIAIENVRLFQELQARTRELTEALQQQTATADVLKIISRSTFDLKSVLQTLVESAARLCEADQATITRQIDGVFYDTEGYGLSHGFLELARTIPVKPDRGSAAGRALLEGKVIQIADVEADPEYTYGAQRLGGYRTLLGVPMLREGVPIGTLSLGRREVRPFTEKQIELVSTFADQAAIAIENARLFEEVQSRTRELEARGRELSEALQQQTATADVLKVISRSAFDLKTVLQTLVESAAKLCDADKATITRQIDGVFYRAEAYGFSQEFMELVRSVSVEPGRGTASGRALLEGKMVHIADVERDPEYTYAEAKRLGGFRTILGVPMLRDGKAIGVLALTRSEVRPFTDKQIELVSTFADQAAIAIENVRLFESVEARTRELVRSLEDLRAAQDRLIQTEKLASLGQLTAGIAHEIKNPLNFVNNFSILSVELLGELRELIENSGLDERRRADVGEVMAMLKGNLEKVSQHGHRADSIVKNMLLHSRQGSGEHRLANINAIVEESLNLAYHGARAERQGFNITLEKSLDPEAGEVDLYPQDITRVLLNLISNGFYATVKRNTEMSGLGYEPSLLAATRNLGDRVEIRIRDNGTGIRADVKEKIFVPFFTTKPAGEGTGLGLSLSHDIIVKQHAGTIEVDTKAGEFTEFRIVLPRTAV